MQLQSPLAMIGALAVALTTVAGAIGALAKSYYAVKNERRRERANAERQRQEEVDLRIKNLQDAVSDLQHMVTVLREDLTAEKQRSNTLEDILKNTQHRLAQLKTELATARAKNIALEAEIKKLREAALPPPPTTDDEGD